MCKDRQTICAIVDVKSGVHRHQRIDLSADHPAFFKIPIWVFVLANFFAEIPNGSLHRPLCVTGKWTCTDSFWGNMGEEVYTVSDKVLIINRLEIPHKSLESQVAASKILWRNNRALEYLNASN
jgi:hypothetical protein